MSRNCPDKSVAKSKTSGKPPGVQINTIRMDLREIEALRDHTENTSETTGEDELFLGLINFAPSENGTGELEELSSHGSQGEGNQATDDDDGLPDLQSVSDSDESLDGEYMASLDRLT
ncbi:hypothetical protein H0H92_014536, partial [Tricholoma furcatifolium]